MGDPSRRVATQAFRGRRGPSWRGGEPGDDGQPDPIAHGSGGAQAGVRQGPPSGAVGARPRRTEEGPSSLPHGGPSSTTRPCSRAAARTVGGCFERSSGQGPRPHAPQGGRLPRRLTLRALEGPPGGRRRGGQGLCPGDLAGRRAGATWSTTSLGARAVDPAAEDWRRGAGCGSPKHLAGPAAEGTGEPPRTYNPGAHGALPTWGRHARRG